MSRQPASPAGSVAKGCGVIALVCLAVVGVVVFLIARSVNSDSADYCAATDRLWNAQPYYDGWEDDLNEYEQRCGGRPGG